MEAHIDRDDSAEVFQVFMCPECKKPTDLCEDTKLALAQCYNEKLEDKYKPSEVEVINEVEEELESRDNSPETEVILLSIL